MLWPCINNVLYASFAIVITCYLTCILFKWANVSPSKTNPSPSPTSDQTLRAPSRPRRAYINSNLLRPDYFTDYVTNHKSCTPSIWLPDSLLLKTFPCYQLHLNCNLSTKSIWLTDSLILWMLRNSRMTAVIWVRKSFDPSQVQTPSTRPPLRQLGTNNFGLLKLLSWDKQFRAAEKISRVFWPDHAKLHHWQVSSHTTSTQHHY